MPHAEDRLGLADCGARKDDCGARKEARVRVCRKSVDRGCPMVALSVRSMAPRRRSFPLLGLPPVPAEPCRRV